MLDAKCLNSLVIYVVYTVFSVEHNTIKWSILDFTTDMLPGCKGTNLTSVKKKLPMWM